MTDVRNRPGASKKLIFLLIATLALATPCVYLWHVKSKYDRQWQISTAAGKGNLPEVKRLLAEGADINVTPTGWEEGSPSGFPSLILAAGEGHDEVVKFLLDHGAKTEVCVEDTPLLAAVIKGHYNITKMLLEHGANPNVRGEGTPLLDAVDRGDIKTVALLLKYGADPGMGLGDSTPLSDAQYHGDPKMIALFSVYGAKK